MILFSLLVGFLFGASLSWVSRQQGLASLSYYQNASRAQIITTTLVRFVIVGGITMGILSTGMIATNYFLGAFFLGHIAGTIFYTLTWR